jgi:DNA-binding beta-propeller fold protein YncE
MKSIGASVYSAILALACTGISACSYHRVVIAAPESAIITPDGTQAELTYKGMGRYIVSSSSESIRLLVTAPGYVPSEVDVSGVRWGSPPLSHVELQRVRHRVSIETIGEASGISVDGKSLGTSRVETDLTEEDHSVVLSRQGIPDQRIPIRVEGDTAFRFRHQSRPTAWTPVGVFRTGPEPKQVSFTPDKRFLIVTLLEGNGFDLIDLRSGGTSRRVSPPTASKRGFVESLVCPEKGVFWISQMTTDMLFEYSLPTDDYPEPRLLRSLPSRTTWTKVMAVDPSYRYLAVSGWLSGNVAVLDYSDGSVVAMLKGISVPRGLAFSPDGSTFYVCSYEGGALYAYDVPSWKRNAVLSDSSASFRHVVVSPDGKDAYVSAMGTSRVYRVDARTLEKKALYEVGKNPNTIALSADGERLYISCRGPNNPKSYYLRSPEDGKVYRARTVPGWFSFGVHGFSGQRSGGVCHARIMRTMLEGKGTRIVNHDCSILATIGGLYAQAGCSERVHRHFR